LLSTTRYPSPLEPAIETLLNHFGYQILRAILLSAGSEGPRSVIPNLAELLATFTTRVNGVQMGEWLTGILGEEGFPSVKATGESKVKLKGAVLRYVFYLRTRNRAGDITEGLMIDRGLHVKCERHYMSSRLSLVDLMGRYMVVPPASPWTIPPVVENNNGTVRLEVCPL